MSEASNNARETGLRPEGQHDASSTRDTEELAGSFSPIHPSRFRQQQSCRTDRSLELQQSTSPTRSAMSAIPTASPYRSRQSSATSSGGGKRPGSVQAGRPPCPGCASVPETYICAICLSKLLKLYKSQTAAHEATLLPAATARAKQGVISSRDSRYLQADAWTRTQKSSGIDAELRRLKLDIGRAEEEVRQKRELLSHRRQTLHQARSKLEGRRDGTTPVVAQEPAEDVSQSTRTTLAAAHATLSAELAETRRILLGELLEALNITEGEGQPPRPPDTAADHRVKSIGGLRLPPLRAIRGEIG